MTDEEVIKWCRRHYGKDFGKTLQKVLADDGRFSDYLRKSFLKEIEEQDEPSPAKVSE